MALHVNAEARQVKDESKSDSPHSTLISLQQQMFKASPRPSVADADNNDDVPNIVIDRRYVPCVICGPSGAGKHSLLDALKKRFDKRFSVAISHTTRPRRADEIDGDRYYFISLDEFEAMNKNGEFLNSTDILNYKYGITKASVAKKTFQRQISIFEFEINGALMFKKAEPDSKLIFITAPGGVDTLRQRLEKRGTDSEAVIQTKLKNAAQQLTFLDNNSAMFDAVISNENFDNAFSKLCSMLEQWYPHIKGDPRYIPTVVCGPSGVGKGTLLRYLQQSFPNIFDVAVSHTTRAKRDGEIEDVNYHYITEQRFKQMIDEHRFVEWANVHGKYYGTSKRALRDLELQRKIPLLEIDYVGAQSIKKSGFNARYLFITMPGGVDQLKERLRSRGTENDTQINKRMETAVKEFKFWEGNKDFFDYTLVNGSLDVAKKDTLTIFTKWYPWISEQ